jgi:hypothetical protein
VFQLQLVIRLHNKESPRTVVQCDSPHSCADDAREDFVRQNFALPDVECVMNFKADLKCLLPDGLCIAAAAWL